MNVRKQVQQAVRLELENPKKFQNKMCNSLAGYGRPEENGLRTMLNRNAKHRQLVLPQFF